jgi:hypothetical protein
MRSKKLVIGAFTQPAGTDPASFRLAQRRDRHEGTCEVIMRDLLSRALVG